MTTYARNLPEGGGTPAPPPPPPPVPLAEAKRAFKQANRIFDALCLDPDATLNMLFFAWDIAHVATQDYYARLAGVETPRTWQGVTPR